MGEVGFIIPRLIIGVFVQSSCSFSTLPLYAIVTQMGNSFKAIFDQHIQEGLAGWAQKAKRRKTAGKDTNGSQVSTLHVESSVTSLEMPMAGSKDFEVEDVESLVREKSLLAGSK